MTKTAEIINLANELKNSGFSESVIIAALNAIGNEQGTETAPAKDKAPAKSKAPAKDKAPAKSKAPKPKYEPVLDTKRVSGMVKTAQTRLANAGYEVTANKQGFWVWLYPKDGKGRDDAFKNAKLAKGWKYSPKRAAFYRDFTPES